ncbi:leucyl aminopeptidase family protein [Oecophyllibacter saccharovorans]|uniref:leucyl aminopeptidase family protein n=1 Tax=Oecophyllibacter saccharovorans TaxID=2558360 RepID=UPI001172722A|nr:leucyl aminopeptidase family protein [Oecophyllibacter saccharovorans]TPW36743.1 leucyl aminopeptidase family protein [Oecophyllibacter saccharovorans]
MSNPVSDPAPGAVLPLVAPPASGQAADSVLPLYLVAPGDKAAIERLCGAALPFLRAQWFEGKAGDFTLLPELSSLVGQKSAQAQDRKEEGLRGALFCLPAKGGPYPFGSLAQLLPPGLWRLEGPGEAGPEQAALQADAVLGFCLGRYRYRLGGEDAKPEPGPRLVRPQDLPAETEILARAIWFGRDLVNMPANLLGPAELAEAAALALKARGAEVEWVTGDALAVAYPCLAAAGAGSDRAPVVIVGKWGMDDGRRPKLSLVGKGVCFDTGGYDLKPASAMLRMKKDMGGAALVLALACALIEAGAELVLEIRLGCIENSVSGHAMRPSDVVQTRKGLTVEIGNTDAEGRLVLCDLLTAAAESEPDILLDASTLTGAARVALGPDLPALFANDDITADRLIQAGREVHDPMWRLPLWDEYESWLDSDIADCCNLSSQPMAGAITAALFLQKFVPPGQKWVHIDTYSWSDTARPGRPKGAEILALRALFKAFSRYQDR